MVRLTNTMVGFSTEELANQYRELLQFLFVVYLASYVGACRCPMELLPVLLFLKVEVDIAPQRSNG